LHLRRPSRGVREPCKIGESRIVSITWSDHIDPKIALECYRSERHFKGKKTALMGIPDWVAAARKNRRMDDDR
jgi:hypothetical protein